MTTKKDETEGAGVLGTVVEALLPSLLEKITSKIGEVIGNLFKAKPKPVPPPVAPTKPVRAGGEDEFPDDSIPAPKHERTIAKVMLRLSRAQYNKQRFPLEYTDANPLGLLPDAELRKIQAGESALPWASKFWLDLTALDADGREFLRPDIVSRGLAFKTRFQVGDAFIEGHGPDAPGSTVPKAEYETNDTDTIGNGISAWLSSVGFLHQMKAQDAADGQEFTVSGIVNGVASNSFVLKVS